MLLAVAAAPAAWTIGRIAGRLAGGDIEGATNPTLTVAAGTVVRLTGRTGDGGTHNIGILAGGGTPLDVAKFVAAGERVAVVGTNGIGKTTLLRAIVGELPVEHGTVKWAENAEVAYMPQDHAAAFEQPVTVFDWMRARGLPRDDDQAIRATLGRLLFSRDEMQKTVAKSSKTARKRGQSAAGPARSWSSSSDMKKYPTTARVYGPPEGRNWKPGELWRNPDLARTLRRLVEAERQLAGGRMYEPPRYTLSFVLEGGVAGPRGLASGFSSGGSS